MIFIETQIISSNGRITVLPAVSDYPMLGRRYSHDGYYFDFAEPLEKTGKNCYESKKCIPEGMRRSTSADELAIQLGGENLGIHPREMTAYKNVFEGNMRLRTKTGLRVPKGLDPSEYEIEDGRKYYTRMGLICSTPVGLVRVPESGVIPYSENPSEVFDLVLGIPLVTVDDIHHKHTTRFLFNPNPPQDSKSENFDVYVGRLSYPLDRENDRDLYIIATHTRDDADPDDAIRLVRGPLPKIRREEFNPIDAALDRMG